MGLRSHRFKLNNQRLIGSSAPFVNYIIVEKYMAFNHQSNYMNHTLTFSNKIFTFQISLYTLRYWSLKQCWCRREKQPFASVFELRLPPIFFRLKVDK